MVMKICCSSTNCTLTKESNGPLQAGEIWPSFDQPMLVYPAEETRSHRTLNSSPSKGSSSLFGNNLCWSLKLGGDWNSSHMCVWSLVTRLVMDWFVPVPHNPTGHFLLFPVFCWNGEHFYKQGRLDCTFALIQWRNKWTSQKCPQNHHTEHTLGL